MKRIIFALYFICYVSSAWAQTESEFYIFKVTFNSIVVGSDDQNKQYLNYIYTGIYENDPAEKDTLLNKYTQSNLDSTNIFLIFSDLIYIVSFNNYKQEDGWNIISKAHITMIYLLPDGQEKNKINATLTNGIIKFDPELGLILFIKTSIKEAKPEKEKQFKKT